MIQELKPVMIFFKIIQTSHLTLMLLNKQALAFLPQVILSFAKPGIQVYLSSAGLIILFSTGIFFLLIFVLTLLQNLYQANNVGIFLQVHSLGELRKKSF